MKAAALLTDEDTHLLDHLAPLSFALNIPLFLTEEKTFQLAKHFYPQIQTIFLPHKYLSLQFLSQHFDTLIQTKFWPPSFKENFQFFFNKKMRLIFCPHGHSDKGYLAPLLTPYTWQDIVLFYGPHLQHMLKELNLWDKINNKTMIGNFRFLFYQTFRSHFDSIAQKQVKIFIDKKKKTLLYAPTWNDMENSSSFSSIFHHVIEQIPKHFNLIVKLHPLLKRRDPQLFYRLTSSCLSKNICLLIDFSPVYPVLQITDIFLGDFSSVGYDFLLFQKPMFFHIANNKKNNPFSSHLHSCGINIPQEKIHYLVSFIKKNLKEASEKKEKQKSTYLHAFGNDISLKQIKKNIFSLCKNK